jgi:hypothetical protein
MRCCWDVCRRSTFALQLPPVCPAGRTNAVTTARLYSTAHRRRLLIVWPLCRRLAGVYIAGMWPRGTRESNGRGPAATTAMWPAVLTGGRPSLEAAGQLPAGSALALCRSVSGGISLAKAAGHRQVADKQEAAGGCGPRRSHGSCPNGAGVSCKGRDSVRSTWRGNCRALVERDLFS